MNQYLEHAFKLGQEKACRDLGLTKEAGPLWAGVKRFLPGLAMGLGGAGVGALANPENRAKGALMGGLGGLGLYGGIRGGRALAGAASGAGGADKHILSGILGLGGLGAGIYAGSKVAPEPEERPGLFSLTPERVAGLKQLLPIATQLLPAMVRQQGQPPLPDLSGAASPEMAYAMQPEMLAPYPEMSGGYPQGMM